MNLTTYPQPNLSGVSRQELQDLLLSLVTLEKRLPERVKTEPIWQPLPGPQTQAYYSEADVLGFGGSGGGGKTDLLLGLAGTAHQNAVIFRRIFPSLRGIIERSREIYNSRGHTHLKDSYNESLHIWRLADGRLIEMAAMQYEKDKEAHRGRPRDFYGFDEATEFSESQVRFVTAWNRTTRPGQRCRIVLTFNPPTTVEGEWVIRYFGPWLSDRHPNPAEPGELRWYAMLNGEDVEVENGEPIEHEGEIIYPRSRTFIPARLSDNPYLEKSGYRAILQGLPEPLRSQMLYGDFNAGIDVDPWQVIPTPWIDAAIERGRGTEKPSAPQTRLSIDPARGGRDKTVIGAAYDNWIAPLVKIKGIDTPDGPSVAAAALNVHKDNAPIGIDVIGIGSSVYDSLKEHKDADGNGLTIHPINGAESSQERDRSGKFRLVNLRTVCYWKLREALDPESGENICLPDDAELRADLMAPRFKVTVSGIAVEPKNGPGSISERLGRSPDCGDAVVYLFAPAPVVYQVAVYGI